MHADQISENPLNPRHPLSIPVIFSRVKLHANIYQTQNQGYSRGRGK
jgi:hypothetical protein